MEIFSVYSDNVILGGFFLYFRSNRWDSSGGCRGCCAAAASDTGHWVSLLSEEETDKNQTIRHQNKMGGHCR